MGLGIEWQKLKLRITFCMFVVSVYEVYLVQSVEKYRLNYNYYEDDEDTRNRL